MKIYYLFLLSFLAFTISVNSTEKSDSNTKSFVVVELFTSEGCSSCPPADKLLGEIISDAKTKNQPVFALSFHVDYWNYIGWTDPYSDEAYSLRQRKYGQAFRASRIYTPQMIVNGTTEFVGSNRTRANSAIKKALKQAASVSISANLIGRNQNQLTVAYNTTQLSPETVVNIALVERDLVQSVKRGENYGRKLRHENVVRFFTTSNSAKDTVKIELPDDVKLENCSVIVYVQNSKTMTILGANELGAVNSLP